MKIAFFITSHGFGHAGRAAAVMEALQYQMPKVWFELFTACPQRFFKASLKGPFGYHPVTTDLGMVQLSPLQTDLAATSRVLDRLLPFNDTLIDDLARQLTDAGCRLVLCDIAAMGIAAARRAGLPSVLVENFTWDWIYKSYLSREPGLKRHIDYLSDIYSRVDLHIQTHPLCRPIPGKPVVGPISRRPRACRDEVRRGLNIPDKAKMALVSMGGVPDTLDFLDKIPAQMDMYLVIPGADKQTHAHPRVRLLPTHSAFSHPDLMQAADALIAKAGYSTLAEAYYAGIPFGYISRTQWLESPALEAFIQRHMPCHSITAEEYWSGRWIDRLPTLTDLPRTLRHEKNGAESVADLIRPALTQGL